MNSQVDSAITALSGGGFVVTWSSNGQDGSSFGVYGQRYDASGAAVGSEFRINTYTADSQGLSTIAALSGGGFVVAWDSSGQDGDLRGVFGQRYDASGAAVGSEFQINTYVTLDQTVPSITALSGGDLLLPGNPMVKMAIHMVFLASVMMQAAQKSELSSRSTPIQPQANHLHPSPRFPVAALLLPGIHFLRMAILLASLASALMRAEQKPGLNSRSIPM